MGKKLKFKAMKLLVFIYLVVFFFGGLIMFMIKDLIKRPRS